MVDLNQLRSNFEKRYGCAPRLFSAPGRVNLIGEHTDYNDGFVLPLAINRRTYVAISPRNDRQLRMMSTELNDDAVLDLDQAVPDRKKKWASYIGGVAWVLAERGLNLTGADLMVSSDVPIGGGLSSSAALEIATGKALTAIAGADIEPLDLALAAREAEHKFVGAKVGIMDQLTATLGQREHALLIDCRSFDVRPISLRKINAAIVVCNTNVKHDLASSAYNQRREECERGVELLSRSLPGIRALRDVTVADFEAHGNELPEPIRRRCRHVVTENARTLRAADAVEQGDSAGLGQLMNESHASLRDDYEVSSRELDVMVEIATGNTAVFGARMMGGGFGGCTINLVRPDAVKEFCRLIDDRYRAATGKESEIYVVDSDDGAREEKMVRTGTGSHRV
jgi:galactokinase